MLGITQSDVIVNEWNFCHGVNNSYSGKDVTQPYEIQEVVVFGGCVLVLATEVTCLELHGPCRKVEVIPHHFVLKLFLRRCWSWDDENDKSAKNKIKTIIK